ncbi:MAG: ribosomal RNA small subunit methyltransferase A [Armatimonadetes bacterium]|nr:ribosomal RNA small subunit methyltransferase A [Armatimonadota bacterium]
MGRRLGQHWLADRAVAERIVESLALRADESVVEIGGGRGALTEHLATRGRRRVVIELDDDCADGLTRRFGEAIEVQRGDVLGVRLAELGPGPWAIVGNLPYYATSPILLWLCAQSALISRAVVMMQAEVAERVLAPPASRERGRLSVALQYRFRGRRVLQVAPGSFAPPPAVNSTVIELVARPEPAVVVADEKRFFAVVEAGFRHRRKTLSTALSSTVGERAVVDAALAAAEVDPKRRAETLTMAEWAAVAEGLTL